MPIPKAMPRHRPPMMRLPKYEGELMITELVEMLCKKTIADYVADGKTDEARKTANLKLNNMLLSWHPDKCSFCDDAKRHFNEATTIITSYKDQLSVPPQ